MASRERVRRRSERAEPAAPASDSRAGDPAAELLLALQRGAGNRAVARYVNPGGGSTPAPPDFLAAQQANLWLDGMPMLTLNSLLDAPFSGAVFSETTFDRIKDLVPGAATPGVVDELALALLLPKAVDRGLQTQMAHIAELQLFGGTRLDLSLRFDPALPTAFKSVPEGPVNAVVLGPAAFESITALQDAIRAALPPVAGPAAKAAPQRLAGEALKAATEHNALMLNEFVSGAIVAAAIGGHASDPATEDFAQWVADFQGRKPLPVNGQLDDATMAAIVAGLVQRQELGSLLRLLIDYFLLDRNYVADVRFNPDVTRPFELDRTAQGTRGGTWRGDPVTIDFGPTAFVGNFAGIFHTIADAFAQAEAREGGLPELEQQLVGKAEQLIGGTRPDLQESEAALRADVRDFLATWHTLRTDDPLLGNRRKVHLKLLRKVVERVEERFKLLGLPDAREVRQLRFALNVMQP